MSSTVARRTAVSGRRYVEDGAVRVARLVGHEPGDRCGHLVGLARPAHRERGGRLRRAVDVAAVAVDLGADDPRSHAVHPHALGRHLLRRARGSGCRSRPSTRRSRRTSPGCRRGHAADDTNTIEPPAPPCTVDIRSTASRAQRIWPVTFTAIIRATRSPVNVSSRAAMSTMPALATSPVSGPTRSTAWVEQGDDVVLVGHVRLDGGRLHPGRRAAGHDRVGLVLPRPVRHDHVVARLRQPDRGRGPDAPAPAGHDDHPLSLEAFRARSADRRDQVPETDQVVAR